MRRGYRIKETKCLQHTNKLGNRNSFETACKRHDECWPLPRLLFDRMRGLLLAAGADALEQLELVGT